MQHAQGLGRICKAEICQDINVRILCWLQKDLCVCVWGGGGWDAQAECKKRLDPTVPTAQKGTWSPLTIWGIVTVHYVIVIKHIDRT